MPTGTGSTSVPPDKLDRKDGILTEEEMILLSLTLGDPTKYANDYYEKLLRAGFRAEFMAAAILTRFLGEKRTSTMRYMEAKAAYEQYRRWFKKQLKQVQQEHDI